MKNVLCILTLSLFLLSCQNKSRQEYAPALIETQSNESCQQPDTVLTEEVIGQQDRVKTSSNRASSSSSHSQKSSSYDNMRGFDPASENDMEDNGISRYMDNNDEEGWD